MSEETTKYKTSRIQVLGIDPGPKGKGSGMVLANKDRLILSTQIETKFVDVCPSMDAVVIEMVSSYGMAVGMSTFQTLIEAGRLVQIAMRTGVPVYLVPRQQIKVVLCGTAQAKDANIRQAILDRYAPTGGGSTPVVGTKKEPGPLYGMKGHGWAAMAAAMWYWLAKEERGVDVEQWRYTEDCWSEFKIGE